MNESTNTKPWSTALLIGALVLPTTWVHAGTVFVQATTSTKNSGLYDYLLPMFTDQTGVQVNVVAVGTGQAIKNAERCDGDVLLVHAKAAEERFVQAGYGVSRSDLMYNDFVIVGPAADPADLAGGQNVVRALKQILDTQSVFASRGDDSGTHKAEMRLWSQTGVDPTPASGDWYRETGAGMGVTLNTAVGMGAYTLTDRATWLNFGNKEDFVIHVQGDARMFNQYGVIPVNPEHCSNINSADANVFVDWLLSEVGQAAIASYKVNGEQLFFPNAGQ